MVSPLSTQTYHNQIKGAHEHHQNRQVLQFMREIGQPQTIRMLHRVINARGFAIDLVSLRRTITNLSKPNPKGKWHNQWKRPMVTIVAERPCPITKVTVGWYQPVNPTVQFTLFQQPTAA